MHWHSRLIQAGGEYSDSGLQTGDASLQQCVQSEPAAFATGIDSIIS